MAADGGTLPSWGTCACVAVHVGYCKPRNTLGASMLIFSMPSSLTMKSSVGTCQMMLGHGYTPLTSTSLHLYRRPIEQRDDAKVTDATPLTL